MLPRFVESSANLWEAWTLSRAFGKRPSELYGINDEIAAWCFDRAVHLFGTSLEADLEKARGSAKNQFQMTTRTQAVFRRWLGIEQKFKDPLATGQVKSSKTDDEMPEGIVKL
jgi:hypothetical protein